MLPLKRGSSAAVAAVLLCIACGSRPASPVEDATGAKDMSRFALTSLRGTRDGERVSVEATYSDGTQPVTVRMQLRVDPQPKLESGTWKGLGGEGTLHDRSITFLGGQAGPPSFGGSFNLNGPDGNAMYRVSIPLQPLKNPL